MDPNDPNQASQGDSPVADDSQAAPEPTPAPESAPEESAPEVAPPAPAVEENGGGDSGMGGGGDTGPGEAGGDAPVA